MEYSAKTRLPLQLWRYHLSFAVTQETRNCMTLHSFFTNRGESISPQKGRILKGLSSSPFLAINAKGGESIKPKAKGPHHHHFKIFTNVYFNWYLS